MCLSRSSAAIWHCSIKNSTKYCKLIIFTITDLYMAGEGLGLCEKTSAVFFMRSCSVFPCTLLSFACPNIANPGKINPVQSGSNFHWTLNTGRLESIITSYRRVVALAMELYVFLAITHWYVPLTSCLRMPSHVSSRYTCTKPLVKVDRA